MSFPSSFLDEIRSRVVLRELIGRHVKLIRKGHEYSGLCPFHNEKTPSFTVSEEKGFFHCFGCGAHGDAIGYVMRFENLTFPEAVKRLAQEIGISVPNVSPEELKSEKIRSSLYDVMEKACHFFEKSLKSPQGANALKYLRGRGLDDDDISRFRLGYAPESRNILKQALISASVSESLLIDSGLLIKLENRGMSYERFRNRVIFPISDQGSRIIGFGGRALGDVQPKYLNSPDTALFQKGSILYNIKTGRSASVAAGRVIVVEGYMDVIALARAGIKEAVATLGTALSERQLALLWKIEPEPVLCFDGDNAGVLAAYRAAERALPLLQPGKSLRFIFLPSGEDPDTLLKSAGRDAMEEILGNASTLSQVIWNMEAAQQTLDTPERLAGFEHRLEKHARSIVDKKVQYQYRISFRAKLSQMTSKMFSQKSLRGANSNQQSGATNFTHKARNPPETLAKRREEAVLATVIRQPALLDGYAEAIGKLEFSDPELNRVRQEILTFYASSPDLDRKMLMEHLRLCGFNSKTGVILFADTLIKRGQSEIQMVDGTVMTEMAQLRVMLSELIQGARLEEAQRRYEADPNDENLARLLECKKVTMDSYRGNI